VELTNLEEMKEIEDFFHFGYQVEYFEHRFNIRDLKEALLEDI
jgi:hypothetical protein